MSRERITESLWRPEIVMLMEWDRVTLRSGKMVTSQLPDTKPRAKRIKFQTGDPEDGHKGRESLNGSPEARA